MPARPQKRTLVRWNDDHDKELLMWVVWCSNEQGIKIPFARVAQCMGASFTEGAIVQHLAKIRQKMEEAGLHVPPAQKRGTATRTGSSIYRPKPKDISAPPPRVRTTAAPPVFFNDEDEEEDEEHLDFSEASRTYRTRKPTRRQADLTLIKEDSEEDEPCPPFYDSDNEYGAKKSDQAMSSQPEAPTPKMQTKLNFGSSSVESQTASIQGFSNDLDLGPKRSPVTKIEDGDDRLADFLARPPQKTGIRRKMSVVGIGSDNDDDDYKPAVEKKPRNKKAKTTRATKRQKVAGRSKGESDNSQDAAAKRSHEETHNADRIAMPPPSRPTSTNNNFGWNSNFVQQPFAIPSYQTSDLANSNFEAGSWNEHSPTTAQFDNFDFQPGFGYNGQALGTFNSPGVGYIDGAMFASTSGPNTRNSSFASAASNSTVESQPLSWTQPIRSPGYPNPREATMALHRLQTTPGAGASTLVNAFASPFEDQNMHVGWNAEMDNEMSASAINSGMRRPECGDVFMGAPMMSDEEMARFINNEPLFEL